MFINILSNVAIMLIYMLLGLFLCKMKKATPAHAKSMSGLLIYILGPMMITNSFLRIEYTREIFFKIMTFLFTTLILQFLFFCVLYLIFHKKYEQAKYRILTCASVLGNVGFFGIPIVNSVYPNNPIVSCYCSVHVMSMNILVFTLGAFLITNDRKYMSVKSIFLNPTTLSLFVAIPIFVLKIKLPMLLDAPVELLAKMATPVCLIILGMRLSEANIKDLFTRPFVYAACFFKLLIYPLFAYGCVVLLPCFDDVFKGSILVLSAAPAGAIIESLAELYECEQELSANAVLMTTLMSVITVPIILLLLSSI